MALQLYINGHLMHLEPGQVIAQTKQVNDLNSLETRQTSYTNKFKLPKTAHNTKALEFLTVTGNRSGVPYNKNECSLYSETGECFVYKGWAVITDGGSYYEAVIYDGIIDLYKAIENKTLYELGLEELNHTKDMATIMSRSFSANLGYGSFAYIFGDYNGKTTAADNALNIDYLVPSVRILFLWKKIFEKHNAQFAGSVFATQNFKNLFMTFPKGLPAAQPDTVVFKTAKSKPVSPTANSYYILEHQEIIQNNIQSIINGKHLKVQQAGAYKLTIKGTLYGRRFTSRDSTPVKAKIYIGKNKETVQNTSDIIEEKLIADDVESGVEYTNEPPLLLDLEANDTICIMATRATSENAGYYSPAYTLRNDDDNKFEVRLSYVQAPEVRFDEVLKDFSIRDFVTEVVQRFGLTVFKDKYTNTYTFLTLQELMQGEVVNWTSKFSRVVSENYVYGNYAQNNVFKYNYNDKESSHNDGIVTVNNKNLPDTRDIFKSKIYSPERDTIIYFNTPQKVYKLWEKELNDDGTIEYKPLDKRYYFLRCTPSAANQAVTLTSEVLNQSDSTSYYVTANHDRLNFQDVIQDYYMPLQQLLSRSLMVTAEMHLKDTDIINLDFKKLYYIEQLSAYFMLNKVSNYLPGRLTKCELMQVPYTAPSPASVTIKIKKIIVSGNNLEVHYVISEQDAGALLQTRQPGSEVWVNPWGGLSPVSTWHPAGTFTVRIWANGFESNHVEVTIPNNTTIEIP